MGHRGGGKHKNKINAQRQANSQAVKEARARKQNNREERRRQKQTGVKAAKIKSDTKINLNFVKAKIDFPFRIAPGIYALTVPIVYRNDKVPTFMAGDKFVVRETTLLFESKGYTYLSLERFGGIGVSLLNSYNYVVWNRVVPLLTLVELAVKMN